MSQIDVTVEEYRIVQKGAKLIAERHGHRWRDLTGDNLVLVLAMEIEELRAKLADAVQNRRN